MKSQVPILVKSESIFSKAMTVMWFINIFKKTKVNAYIDSENDKRELTASKEPYLIELNPGPHAILFEDPKAKSKQITRMLTGAFIGGSFGLAGGSFSDGVLGGMDFFTNEVKDGIVTCNLSEGEVLKLEVKPKSNGNIKIKILKK